MSEYIDNRRYRIEKLKQIIQGLHKGEDRESVRRKLHELVKETDATEIAAMEQQLMAEGMPAEEITKMCDLHSDVLREILTERLIPPITPGHPVDTFLRENKAIQDVIRELRILMSALAQGPEGSVPERKQVLEARQKFGLLMDVEKHYLRKENLLFPALEKHGNTGPSKVMWAKDDEIRALLKGLRDALAQEDIKSGEWKVVLPALAEPAFKAAEEMIYKEENILLPMAREVLSDAEWAAIWQQTPEIGYALIEPGTAYRPLPAAPDTGEPSEGAAETAKQTRLVTASGTLTLEQIKNLLNTLPVDLTFVDENDEVRYFTESKDRVFLRPKAILGRKVQHCHPPSSLHVVEKIVSDFRSGRKNTCAFWIEHQGKFIYIRYLAVRDENGRYLGTLEVTQDLTKERALKGERRLLQYDEE